MMKRLITVCLSVLILSLAAVYAAEKDKASVQIDPSKLPPPAEKKDVTYNADIKPLLEKSCVKCHGAADKPKAGLRLDSKGAVLQGSKNGKVIEVDVSICNFFYICRCNGGNACGVCLQRIGRQAVELDFQKSLTNVALRLKSTLERTNQIVFRCSHFCVCDVA